MRNPFARPKPNPKRAEPRRVRGREILRTEAKLQRRWEIFERSGGKCEEKVLRGDGGWVGEIRCNRPITFETMHWSHKRHAANKCDCLNGGIASCEDCHRKRHNAGGKPCPRKAGREMNHTEAIAYWKGLVCFCGGEKRPEISFCQECMAKLPKQLHYDVNNSIGDYYLRALSLSEKFLLAWKPEEERTAS